VNVLATDVIADGGGRPSAARRPVAGREREASALSRFKDFTPGVGITTPLVNGSVAARIDPGARSTRR
jgi:RNA polymerase sigma-70 factor (ECF subfamily)